MLSGETIDNKWMLVFYRQTFDTIGNDYTVYAFFAGDLIQTCDLNPNLETILQLKLNPFIKV